MVEMPKKSELRKRKIMPRRRNRGIGKKVDTKLSEMGKIVGDFLDENSSPATILKLKNEHKELTKRNKILEKRCIKMGQEKKALRKKIKTMEEDYNRFDILYFEEDE